MFEFDYVLNELSNPEQILSSRIIRQQHVSGSIIRKPAHQGLGTARRSPPPHESAQLFAKNGPSYVEGEASASSSTAFAPHPGSSGALTPPRSRSPCGMEIGDENGGNGGELDELSRIRALLHPPSTPGIPDWGIPPEPEEECDPELEARVMTSLL